MKRLMSIAITALVLTGCEQRGPNQQLKLGPRVETRSANQVAGCAFLGTVQSIPKLFGVLKTVGQRDAERAAKSSVKKAGGNVVVFDPVDPEAEVFQVTGRAYSCPDV